MNRSAEHEDLVNRILLAAGSRPDVRVWRRTVGAAKLGGRYIRFGLPGEPDITGITKTGRRLEIEVKTGRAVRTKDQLRFANILIKWGALYILAHRVSDVTDVLDREYL